MTAASGLRVSRGACGVGNEAPYAAEDQSAPPIPDGRAYRRGPFSKVSPRMGRYRVESRGLSGNTMREENSSELRAFQGKSSGIAFLRLRLLHCIKP